MTGETEHGHRRDDRLEWAARRCGDAPVWGRFEGIIGFDRKAPGPIRLACVCMAVEVTADGSVYAKDCARCACITGLTSITIDSLTSTPLAHGRVRPLAGGETTLRR